VLTNSDRVTISNGGNLTLTKEVCNTTIGACDVLLGTGFSLANTGAPGDVLTYRIVFEVTGSTPVDSLEIADITPAYSRLAITAPSVVIEPDGVSCSLSDPAAPTQGYEGVLKWVCTGSVAPGSLGTVAFDVRISQ
jgi:hypothetical protein